jgi:hypothetical protein
MINLTKFKQYLSRSATGNDSPVSIKAKDLDDNFNAVTLLDSSRGVYTADYSPLGTEIVLGDHDSEASWQYIRVTDVNGSPKILNILGASAGDGFDSDSFQIVVQKSSDTQYVWGIGSYSAIYSDFKGSSRTPIAGTIDGASGWYPMSSNDEMWVELTSDGVVSSAIVRTKGNGNSYSTNGGTFSKLIGRNLGTATVPRIQQIMPIGAQRVSNQCVNGISTAILVAF